MSRVLDRPITGVRPFNELPIDAQVWQESHDHHHLHRFLHATAAHRPGIIQGLEVFPAAKEGQNVVVAPGVGVDTDGQTLVLREPVVLSFTERGQSYVTLSYLPQLSSDSAVSLSGGGKEHYRLIEGRDVTVSKELPNKPYLELGRVYRTGAEAPVREAINPFDPGPDELDLLNRRIAFPHCYADAAIGEISYVPDAQGAAVNAWKPNRAGLWNLLNEGNGRGFHLEFYGLYSLRNPVRAGGTERATPVLLYMAGQYGFKPLPDADIEGLQRFLATGGLLMGEACGGDKGEAFARSFADLAFRLGARPIDVSPRNPLMTAHHVFPLLPPGGQITGKLQIDANVGILFSTFDYGAAWQGEIEGAKSETARERVRQAQEFGLNVIAYATNRRRRLEMTRLV